MDESHEIEWMDGKIHLSAEKREALWYGGDEAINFDCYLLWKKYKRN